MKVIVYARNNIVFQGVSNGIIPLHFRSEDWGRTHWKRAVQPCAPGCHRRGWWSWSVCFQRLVYELHDNTYNLKRYLKLWCFSQTLTHTGVTFLYFFSYSYSPGHHYLSKIDGKYHAGTIESGFKGLHDDIDAAFAHKEHIHIVKVSANEIRHFQHVV